MKKTNELTYIRYPIYIRDKTWFEKLVLKTKRMPIKCPVCGSFSLAYIPDDDFRENYRCTKCSASNRQRQVAFVLCNAIANNKIKSLNDLSEASHLSIYNTETYGSLHHYLSRLKGYVCSDYFGPEYKSGDYVNNIMHQDLMALSIQDNLFDYVITTDVFEHIPEPYVAYQEVYRVLKPGGRHIFTVPFYQTEIQDEKRAAIDDDGKIIYYKDPWYHIDPLRPEGILTYTVFSIEMLVKLSKIGFKTNMYLLYRPYNGILGSNGLVFESIKEIKQPEVPVIQT
jgi:SAM-dependent methyltransferase